MTEAGNFARISWSNQQFQAVRRWCNMWLRISSKANFFWCENHWQLSLKAVITTDHWIVTISWTDKLRVTWQIAFGHQWLMTVMKCYGETRLSLIWNPINVIINRRCLLLMLQLNISMWLILLIELIMNVLTTTVQKAFHPAWKGKASLLRHLHLRLMNFS